MLPLARTLRPSSQLLRTYASLSSSAPSKAHHVLSFPSSAFPLGYSLSSTSASIKKSSPSNPSPLDLGLFLSTSSKPTASAASFTRNVFKAAPVVISQDVLLNGGGRAKALVVNSGCANAVTGRKGMEDAISMVETVDNLISDSASTSLPSSTTSPAPSSSSSSPHPSTSQTSTLILSTGVIGQPIPSIPSNILPSLKSLHDSLSPSTSPQAWLDLAKAFMTTDTFPKLRARTFTLPSSGIQCRIAGIDKGAGMIHPFMGPPSKASSSAAKPMHGTLLGLIATDAAISPPALQAALNYAVDRSFNSITVDGDMSTNDTVVLFANGAAEGAGKEIEEGDADFKAFRDELTSFAEELAKLVVRDGEGATKFVTISVKGAPSDEDAKKVATTVATSSLVKTALYGQDANWGRILCAIGYSQTPINPFLTRVSFLPTDGSSELLLLEKGEPVPFSEDRASEILKEEDLEVVIDLGGGEGSAKVWSCDFSHEYVTINGSYRS